jgi:hypothetical protein
MDQNIIDRCLKIMTADIVDKRAEIVLIKIYSELDRFNTQNDLKSRN